MSKIVVERLTELYPRLWRFCLALTGSRDHAQDLAQASCLRAIEKADLFQLGTRLDFWLFKLTKRVWLNELRTRAVRQQGGLVPLHEIDIADQSPDPEANVISRDVFTEVMSLPEAQRTAVMLVYVEGLSYKEAADVMGIPVGTVMSRLAVARQRIVGRVKSVQQTVNAKT